MHTARALRDNENARQPHFVLGTHPGVIGLEAPRVLNKQVTRSLCPRRRPGDLLHQPEAHRGAVGLSDEVRRRDVVVHLGHEDTPSMCCTRAAFTRYTS